MSDSSSSISVPPSSSVSASSSSRKRPHTTSSDEPSKKKRILLKRSVDNWITEYDKELETSTWLKYDVVDRVHIDCLKCSVCFKFNDKLLNTRNYNSAFVDGSKNLRTSSFKDHAASTMHKRAMILYKKQQGVDLVEYSPIANALSTLDEGSRQVVTRKFEVAYMIAKEKLPFIKMKPFCMLEQHHGVNLGHGYINDHACATFVEYIAQDLQRILLKILSSVKFFSIQSDGTTDAGTIEDELFTIQYFDPKSDDGSVHVRNKFLTVRQLKRGDAQTLFECFKAAMEYIGITDWRNKLIGFGTDGASVNTGAGGLRGFMENEVSWVVFFWCLAHRLELALKDALKATYFATLDEMLMRLYYLYEKSPKKCAQLEMCSVGRCCAGITIVFIKKRLTSEWRK